MRHESKDGGRFGMERRQGRVRGNRFRPACRAGIAVAAATVACLAFAAPAGAVSFTDPALDFDVGAGTAPLSVATGDFNEDANPDVVTANNAGSVSLMLGNGGGGFALASGWPIGSGGTATQSIVVADFNGDDNLDAAASNRTSNDVSVFLGDGAGGVLPAGGGVPASPSTYAVGASGPFYIDKGDFNDDDIVDLVTANQDSNNVSLLIGDGDGTFSSGGTFAVGNKPRGLAVGDVDHDGNDDVVSANFTEPPRGAIGSVTVLLGDGAGGLTAATGSPIPVGQNPRWVTLGDFNEDGDTDIAAANAFTNTDSGCPCADNVTILLGAGDGTFAEADDSPFTTGADTGPFAIEAADFDGDGHLDLATANRFATTDLLDRGFSVLVGDGDGGFASPHFVDVPIGGGSRTGIAIADLNDDTRPDLVSQDVAQGWMLRSLNTTPIAVDDAATVAEDSAANAIDVLANDLDPDGIASVDTTGTNGTVDMTGGGTGVDYTPDPGYCNDPPGTTPDTFTYTLNSGSTATVSVTVTCEPGPHTYFVRGGGSGAVCTQAHPCATVEAALTAHRANPDPGDIIDVGPGLFVGNVVADQPEDEGLTIRGTLTGATKQTTLRGQGAGVFGYAVLLGGCAGEEVKLRDANVDTVSADSDVGALSLDGGSDLLNVHASTQPGSDAFGVVDVCERGSTIDRAEIVAEGDVVALNVFETVRVQDSTITGENFTAISQFSGGDPSREMRIRRSTVSLPADTAMPVVQSTTRLTVDSSLITGGASGLLTFEGVRWLINNSTIDPGQPGVADPVDAQSLFLQPFLGSTTEVAVDSSILVDGIFGNASDGGDATVDCGFSDIAAVDLDPSFTDDCLLDGGSTNTTTPPEDLFEGGAPDYDWMLKAGSPAIDTGQPGAVPAGLAIRDLAGDPRRAAGTTATCPDGIRDKGAYEYVGPPCNVSLPEVLNGEEPEPGTKLSSLRGEWSDKPTGFARLWFRCDENGDDCVEIAPPKTRKGYTVRGPDLGHTLRVQVIASNAAGDSDPARSEPTGVVEAPAG